MTSTSGLSRIVLAAILALIVVAVLAVLSLDGQSSPRGRSAFGVSAAFANPTNPVLRPIAGSYSCLSGYPGTPQRPCSALVRGQYDTAFIAMSPDGKFLYSLSTNEGYKLGPTKQPIDITGGTIAILKRDPKTGRLNQLAGGSGCIRDADAPLNAVTKPCTTKVHGISGAKSMVISSDGRFAYVAALNNDSIAAFSRNPNTGLLRQLPGNGACIQDAGFPQNECPVKGTGLHGIRTVTLSPDGRNLYASAPANDAISSFSIDRTTGVLHQLPGDRACIADHLARLDKSCTAHALAVNYPRSLVVSPDGNNVYVASDTADSSFPGDPADGSAVSAFKRNPQTGALEQLTGDDACIEDKATAPRTTGCPVEGIGLFQPIDVQVSPDGKNVYVGAGESRVGAVTAFSRDPSSGALSQLSGSDACMGGAPGCTKAPGLRGVGGLTITPDGRNVYVAAFYGLTIAVLNRDGDSGRLSAVPAGCIKDTISSDTCPVKARGLNGPRNIVLSPDGKFAYVASETSGTIAVFNIQGS